MYYKQKPNYYPGRGSVKAVEATLMIALVFFVGNALIERFAPAPQAEPVIVYYPSSLEFSVPEPAYNSVSFAQLVDTALAYQAQDNHTAAIDYYTQAILLNADHPVPFLNRGVAYEYSQLPMLAMYDFWTYINKNETISLTRRDYVLGETITVEMSQGRVYEFSFEAQAGDVVMASAMSAVGSQTVDPLIVIVDEYDRPIAANDDVIVNGQLQSMNAYLNGFTIPADCEGDTGPHTYRLIVHHAGGGSQGNINVTLDVLR